MSDEQPKHTFRKTLFSNFLPTKAEEEAAAARNMPHQVTATLVEIRDFYPRPPIDPYNSWQMRKNITDSEVASGNLSLSHHEAFEYVFRHWTMERVNSVLQGNKSFVPIIDRGDFVKTKRYQSEHLYVEIAPDGSYVLGFLDIIGGKPLSSGDEIGLFWSYNSEAFVFELFGGEWSY